MLIGLWLLWWCGLSFYVVVTVVLVGVVGAADVIVFCLFYAGLCVWRLFGLVHCCSDPLVVFVLLTK